MTSYAKGRRAEYECMDILRGAGWEVLRSAGSHGPFDVVAWDRHWVRFIQVKSVRSQPGVYRALKQASDRLIDTILPEDCDVLIELWIRVRGKWRTWMWYGPGWKESGVQDVLEGLWPG